MESPTEVKPKFDEAELGTNPLARKLVVLVRHQTFAKQYALDADADALLPIEADVEYVPYTKLFRDASRRKRCMSLSPRAHQLLTWIAYELDAGKDYLAINRRRYMTEAGIKSENTAKAIEDELITAQYILPTIKRRVFWIDPHHFFAGSRIQKYPKRVQVYVPQTGK